MLFLVSFLKHYVQHNVSSLLKIWIKLMLNLRIENDFYLSRFNILEERMCDLLMYIYQGFYKSWCMKYKTIAFLVKMFVGQYSYFIGKMWLVYPNIIFIYSLSFWLYNFLDEFIFFLIFWISCQVFSFLRSHLWGGAKMAE